MVVTIFRHFDFADLVGPREEIFTMSLFDQSEYTEFNGDHVVLCHEIGHVVVWFHFGEAIGPLKWRRNSGGLLMPSVALWPRSCGIERLYLSPDYAKPYAERLLAGEITARRVLGMRTDQICSKGLPVERMSNYLASELAQITETEDFVNEDIVKVLKLAFNNAQSGWRAWVAERLGQANSLVDENWTAIKRMAQKLKRRLPRDEKPCVWPGLEMINKMERY